MGFMEELRARQKTQAALAQGAPEQAPAPTTVAEQAAPIDIRTRLAQATAGAGALVAPPPFTPPSTSNTTVTVPGGTITTVAPTPGDAPRRGRGRAKAATAPAPPVTPEIVQAMTESVAPSAQTTTPPEVVAEFTRSTYAHGVTMSDGYTLCINCAPIGDPSVILFSQYAEQVHKALKESKGWDHYGLYSFEGKATFQDALQQYIQLSPPVGYLVLWTNTDEGRDALPILERYAAGRPFRGF